MLLRWSFIKRSSNEQISPLKLLGSLLVQLLVSFGSCLGDRVSKDKKKWHYNKNPKKDQHLGKQKSLIYTDQDLYSSSPTARKKVQIKRLEPDLIQTCKKLWKLQGFWYTKNINKLFLSNYLICKFVEGSDVFVSPQSESRFLKLDVHA